MIYDRQFRVFDSRMAVLVTLAVVKQHVPQGGEKERERELLVRRIVEDKAIDLGPPLVFKVLEADCYVCCIFEVISFLEEEEEGIRTRKCAGNRLKSLKREVLKRDSSEFYIGYGDTCLRVNF